MNNAKTKNSRQKPTESDMIKSWTLIEARILRCFALYFWRTQILPGIPQDAPATKIVQNAVLESTMISLRDLDDFFRERDQCKDRDSDLRASDFGFKKSIDQNTNRAPQCKATGPVLGNDRDVINTYLAHLTYHSVWNNPDVPQPETAVDWDTVALVKKASGICFEFMRFLETKWHATDLEIVHRIRLARGFLEKEVKDMEALGSLERDNPEF